MLNQAEKQQLDKLCNTFRMEVLQAIHDIQSGHPGGSLSVCEILTVLYMKHAKVYPDDTAREDQDRVVLCKGHAAPMLYRVLAEKGYFPKEEMNTLRRINSRLQGHPCIHTPGVDMPSGPLGIGLAAAQGMAIALKLDGKSARVYAVLGDGELDEGAVWEAAASAVKFELDNLTAIVDWNKVQLDGTTDQIMPLRDLPGKWAAFGWNVIVCDGHDLMALDKAFDEAEACKGRPTVILANTVKGKGVSFMEGQAGWHGKAIDDESFAKAMAELGGSI